MTDVWIIGQEKNIFFSLFQKKKNARVDAALITFKLIFLHFKLILDAALNTFKLIFLHFQLIFKFDIVAVIIQQGFH